MEKSPYEVVIGFPGSTWKSHVMLTKDEAQGLINRLVDLECEGKIRKDAWYVYQPSPVYTLADLEQFLNEHTGSVSC
jgi:hypothetical protein